MKKTIGGGKGRGGPASEYGGEDEVLGEPESVLTFMYETNVFVCGFTSRMEEEQERQCKGMGPELDKVGGL